MSHCVPSWDLDDNPTTPRHVLRAHSNSKLDYEVAELTWENGQLAMHGLGPPRVPNKPQLTSTAPAKYTWDKPRAGGTLEAIVDQATGVPHCRSSVDCCPRDNGELVPGLDHLRAAATAPVSATMTMDALVPCSNNYSSRNNDQIGTCTVGSCSGSGPVDKARRVGASAAAAGHDWSSRADQSMSGSATLGRDSRQVTVDTCERGLGMAGFTSTSTVSPENTSSGKQPTKVTTTTTTTTTTTDDHDSVCHGRFQMEAGVHEEGKKRGNGKSSVSAKRSRAAAIHNQSERRRRDKINHRMKTLQRLVPNASKTDKASMLDEVIDYLKQLQAQVQMMSRMNMSPMMLPLALQQQLQMQMMAPAMGMGMVMPGMGIGVMDINRVGRPNIPGIPPVLLHPSAFMPLASWESPADRITASTSVMQDPLSAFLACQSQPMTVEAYSRMAAMYKQLYQNPGPTSKN